MERLSMERSRTSVLACVLVALMACAGPSHAEAFFEGLGFLPGESSRESAGLDISSDGLVAVGGCRNDAGHAEAYRWTPTAGMNGLGFLPGATFYLNSNSNAVSADGLVVVGSSITSDEG